jgi:hypothetical protein
MRKISLVAAIALMLAGVGVWATSTTQARLDVPADAQIKKPVNADIESPLRNTCQSGDLDPTFPKCHS